MSKFFIEVPDNVVGDADGQAVARSLEISIRTLLHGWKDAKVTFQSPDPDYLLIQEGGTSLELYVHAHPSEAEAEEDRYSCRDDGSYRTTPVVQIPPELAALGEIFYGTVDEIIESMGKLDFPTGDNPYAEPAEG